MKHIRPQRSYAPIPNWQGTGPAAPPAGGEAGLSSPQQLAQKYPYIQFAGLLQGSSVAMRFGGWTRIARQIGAAGMPAGFYARIRKNRALRAGRTGSAAMLALGSLFGPPLPSIAPRGLPGSGYAGAAGQSQAGLAAMHGGAGTGQTSAGWALVKRQGQNPPGAAPAEDVAVAAAARAQEMKLAFSEYLDQQARLPPCGTTGFDPRLSPAWPGRKMPR